MITAITCSAFPAVENGTITYSSDTTEPYDYGTTAIYQCDSGYELTGGDTVRTCTGDGSSPVGQWDGTAPTCSGINRTHSFIPLFSSLSNPRSFIYSYPCINSGSKFHLMKITSQWSPVALLRL